MARRRYYYREQLPDRDPVYHPIWNNLIPLVFTNLSFILFFLPTLICLYLFLMTGGLIFLAGGLLLLIPAGPAVAALYDNGYQIVREIPKPARRGFFASYRANFAQGCGAMAVLLPLLALLVFPLVAQEKPVWVTVCLLLSLYLTILFAALAFSQIALVALPLKQILKNSLLLPVGMGWRGLLVPAAQLLFFALVYRYIAWGFLFLLILGPAVLLTWSCKLLWPKLKALLLEE